MAPPQPKVAIIGSGVSGLAALWALRNKSSHEVYLYESNDYLGGHTHTVPFKHGSKSTMVDTGFIVLNAATYPNFIAFLAYVGVPTVPTEMTFGISRNRGEFEWSGTSLTSVFAQSSNVFKPTMWRMLFDIVRFNTFALDLLENEPTTAKCGKKEETVGSYLDREGYSQAFRDDYLIPMTAAVWSTSPDKCALEFPAVTLVRFMWNHHLLNIISARPKWLTVKGGAKNYVDAVIKGVPQHQIHLSTPVTSVRNGDNGKILVSTKKGSMEYEYEYDHVIIATHGDQALSLLGENATPLEKDILRAFKTSKNTAVLHSDKTLMPIREETWASWNYMTALTPTSRNGNQVSLTYNMNTLQHIPTQCFGDVLVTLNPLYPPQPSTIQGEYEYEHPLYTPEAIQAQSRLPQIQNKRGITFAGAWIGYGFHEDGFTSGLRAAVGLGAEVPWVMRDAKYIGGDSPRRGVQELGARVLIGIVQWWIVVLEILLTSCGGRAKREKQL